LLRDSGWSKRCTKIAGVEPPTPSLSAARGARAVRAVTGARLELNAR